LAKKINIFYNLFIDNKIDDYFISTLFSKVRQIPANVILIKSIIFGIPIRTNKRPLKTKSPGELASTETLMKNYLPRHKDTTIFGVATSFSKKTQLFF